MQYLPFPPFDISQMCKVELCETLTDVGSHGGCKNPGCYPLLYEKDSVPPPFLLRLLTFFPIFSLPLGITIDSEIMDGF